MYTSPQYTLYKAICRLRRIDLTMFHFANFEEKKDYIKYNARNVSND